MYFNESPNPQPTEPAINAFENSLLNNEFEHDEYSAIPNIQSRLQQLKPKLMQAGYQLKETSAGGFVLTLQTHSRHFIDFQSLFAQLVVMGLVSSTSAPHIQG